MGRLSVSHISFRLEIESLSHKLRIERGAELANALAEGADFQAAYLVLHAGQVRGRLGAGVPHSESASTAQTRAAAELRGKRGAPQPRARHAYHHVLMSRGDATVR